MKKAARIATLTHGFGTRAKTLRQNRRWEKLRDLGMTIAEDAVLPASMSIDTSHCFLIRIEARCVFGERCLILAHDAQMDEFIDAARIGRVVVHPDCHIGHRTVILSGVEIGPRTVVAPNSVIAKSLPPDTYCAGSPARPLLSLEDYLEEQRQEMNRRPNFSCDQYGPDSLDVEKRAELSEACASGPAFLVSQREEIDRDAPK